VQFKNPLMPAAGPFGSILEYARLGDLSTLGALLPNSFEITENQPTSTIKFHYTDFGFLSAFGSNNMDFIRFAEEVLPTLPSISTPVLIDLKAKDMEDMVSLAALVCSYNGIAGVEINLNCPYATPGAKPYWRTPGLVRQLTARVREVISGKLLWVKVPSAESPIEELAREAEEGGAHAFVTFNSIIGAEVDIQTRQFVCGVRGSGGYSGAGVKPIGIWWCNRAFKAVSIPVIAAGGIRCAEDVVEYMMAGASMVQVGSAMLAQPNLIFKMVDNLTVLLREMGIEDINDIIGVAKPL